MSTGKRYRLPQGQVSLRLCPSLVAESLLQLEGSFPLFPTSPSTCGGLLCSVGGRGICLWTFWSPCERQKQNIWGWFAVPRQQEQNTPVPTQRARRQTELMLRFAGGVRNHETRGDAVPTVWLFWAAAPMSWLPTGD